LCRQLALAPRAEIVTATDANAAGDRYAERHAALAAEHNLQVRRLRPPDGLDWNNVLQQRSRA
jgi:DNA primase